MKCIIALVGTSFSGKTTIGKELAKKTNLILLDIDKTREKIDSSKKWLGPEQEKRIMLKCYKKNHEKAKKLLGENKSVILAATYSRDYYHEMLKKLAKKTKASLIIFYLKIPDIKEAEVVKQRMQKRIKQGDKSNVNSMKAYLEQKNRYLLIQDVDLKEINTTLFLSKNIDQIFRALSN